MIDKLADEIKRDRESGTPGPWFQTHVPGWMPSGRTHIAARNHDTSTIAGDCPIAVAKDGATHWENKWPAEVNARRIARLPDLEAAYLAQAELLAEAVEALEACLSNMTAPHANFEAGCCMCGTEMDATGFYPHEGHTPTDAGLYHAEQAIARARATLARIKESTDV